MRVIETWPPPGSAPGSARSPPARYERRVDCVERKKMVRCWSFGWVVVLVALTASMVVLPLMLPPLPPPPLMLLFFPVGIMAALMFLAFSPTESAAGGYGIQELRRNI